jgi:hypothetical protein
MLSRGFSYFFLFTLELMSHFFINQGVSYGRACGVSGSYEEKYPCC